MCVWNIKLKLLELSDSNRRCFVDISIESPQILTVEVNCLQSDSVDLIFKRESGIFVYFYLLNQN